MKEIREMEYEEVCMKLARGKSFKAYVRDYPHQAWEETIVIGIKFVCGDPFYYTNDLGTKCYCGVEDE